jgi:uncharacterized protein (TIGR03382 family)
MGLVAVGLVTAGVGCFRGEDDADSSPNSLVGGTEGGTASLVLLDVGCSAVKVGPRHFVTAARCVAFRPSLEAGGKIRFASSPLVALADGGFADVQTSDASRASSALDAGADAKADASDAATDAATDAVAAPSADAGSLTDAGDGGATSTAGSFREAGIVRMNVHPSFFAKCAGDACAFGKTQASDTPDIAIFEIDLDTQDIPVTPVDLDAIGEADPVVLAGYGCDKNGVLLSPAKARSKETIAVPARMVNHKGSPYEGRPALVGQLSQAYVVTPASGWMPNAPGLCGADIGGALLRPGAKPALIGVHSTYTQFAEGATQLAVTNVHTRLDQASRFKIGTWLKGLGAVTVQSCAADASACPKRTYEGGSPVPPAAPDAGDDAGDASAASDGATGTTKDPGTDDTVIPPTEKEPNANTGDDPIAEEDPESTSSSSGSTDKTKKKTSNSGCQAGGTSSGMEFAPVFAAAALLLARRRRQTKQA